MTWKDVYLVYNAFKVFNAHAYTFHLIAMSHYTYCMSGYMVYYARVVLLYVHHTILYLYANSTTYVSTFPISVVQYTLTQKIKK